MRLILCNEGSALQSIWSLSVWSCTLSAHLEGEQLAWDVAASILVPQAPSLNCLFCGLPVSLQKTLHLSLPRIHSQCLNCLFCVLPVSLQENAPPFLTQNSQPVFWLTYAVEWASKCAATRSFYFQSDIRLRWLISLMARLLLRFGLFHVLSLPFPFHSPPYTMLYFTLFYCRLSKRCIWGLRSCVVTPCSWVSWYRLLEGTQCLHLASVEHCKMNWTGWMASTLVRYTSTFTR